MSRPRKLWASSSACRRCGAAHGQASVSAGALAPRVASVHRRAAAYKPQPSRALSEFCFFPSAGDMTFPESASTKIQLVVMLAFIRGRKVRRSLPYKLLQPPKRTHRGSYFRMVGIDTNTVGIGRKETTLNVIVQPPIPVLAWMPLLIPEMVEQRFFDLSRQRLKRLNHVR